MKVRMTLNTLLRSAAAVVLGLATHTAIAQDAVLLRVSGPDGSSIDYDLAALEAMESSTLHTHTSWTDGPQQFTGVRASQLLAPYDGKGAYVRAVALNDYESRMDFQKLQRYPAIVAYKRNGRYMTIRDKGPLWMVFPQDDFPELRTAETDQEMVWHLKGLIVE